MSTCFFFGREIDTLQILVAVLIGESASAILGVALILHAIPSVARAEVPLSLRTIYSYAIRTYFGTSLKALAQRGDRLILDWFVPSSLVAAYAVAMSLRDSALLPITTHAMLLRNQLIDREQRPSCRQYAGAFLKAELFRWTLISAGIAGSLSLAAPFALPALYGPEFESSVHIFMILSAALPMITVATLCWTGLLSAGRAATVSVGLIFGGILGLVAFYVGAKTGGIIGACYASVIASLIVAAWWLVLGFTRRVS